MTAVVQTKRLTKVLNGREVVSGVHMNVRQGEIYGFLGPNGAGKTTVMRMLLNLVKPTDGRIELFGEPLQEESVEVLKRIGSMIEYPVFYEKLTAYENLELHGRYMGFYDPKMIRDALDLVQLTGSERKRVKDFSLGMKQRLGLARALATKPELLILDEPINGLDPAGIREMRMLFKTLSREYGMTLLVSSHILGEIEQIADTVGVISEGRLVDEVSMETIRRSLSDYIEIVTPHLQRAAFVLEHSLNVTSFKTMGDRTLRVYDSELSPSELSKALILEGVAIEEIHKKANTLESYFFQQIRGGREHA
ncbi:ATP-binding cassette domain-containing protein [Paenibacillus filicis]|uniref:ATP-binding cassette domain-containing protein n=1 Tax=Paenibacillus filicis TaxID=669464 RepID=A0ABU9DJX0_9BACL